MVYAGVNTEYLIEHCGKPFQSDDDGKFWYLGGMQIEIKNEESARMAAGLFVYLCRDKDIDPGLAIKLAVSFAKEWPIDAFDCVR